MNFSSTPLAGVYLVKRKKRCDERGFFTRTFCRETFLQRGLAGDFPQCSLSFNARRGTLRGLHFQKAPYEEDKLVWCSRGAIYDVAVDVRPSSLTYKKWVAYTLTDENQTMLYIPKGCAHGFLTLVDETEVVYHISTPFTPSAGQGVRWDDPALSIDWPLPVTVIATKDQSYDDL